MVNPQTTLCEQLLDLAIGERKAQVPADRQQDDLRLKLTPFELQHFQLLNRLATGGPNNQYFQLHHRTLAARGQA
jgi:hypothetical protein